jgi:SAM-dependent methyltransferase
MASIENQRQIHDKIYQDKNRFEFHITNDILIRYLRDRRLLKSYKYLSKVYDKSNLIEFKVLVVCGGVGGEAIFFKKFGFKNVTNSDLSLESANISKFLDPFLDTDYANAEELPYPDDSFDLVVVQDGLHHLPRPTLGFTEMLRVAKKAIVVIEPRESIIGRLIGTQFEKHEDIENYVFRWSRNTFSAITYSFLLRNICTIKFIGLWDHNLVIGKIVGIFPKYTQLFIAKMIYKFLSIFDVFGNMMVGIVIKRI